ncbi:hypothetical protein E5K00_21190 [Hymenobacter aquaticus]|uniref:DUF4377 domain-containing protein n=1 Tax=Hymenobacter aquaticus TaxID=1867101 RepID=A0A4Z0PU25_9BACT|nr:hypothetical protein [Hymenobacter aquaticus]TGE20511.1 hypothetical protein E5K00_21190 [Hymenobacter aquaticus]
MLLTPTRLLSGLALLAGLSLAGCAEKELVAPEPTDVPCGTLVTVRLCLGQTAMCATEHTTLVLPDGTLLAPSGPIWEAYERNQAQGQALLVGYVPGGTVPPGSAATTSAVVTCLETPRSWCATPDVNNRKTALRRRPW